MDGHTIKPLTLANTFVVGEVLMKPRTIRLPEDLDRLLQDEAEKTGTTEAEIIRRVLCDYYRIREGETSIETLIRRIVGEVLEESTSKSTPRAPQSTSAEKERAPSRTLEAPPRAPYEHLGAPLKSTSKAPLSTPKSTLVAPQSTAEPDVIEVLKIIKAHHDQGEEPTANEVAQEAGMDKRPLGRLMKATGVQAKNTTRGGVTARYYTLDLKPKIEELIAKGDSKA